MTKDPFCNSDRCHALGQTPTRHETMSRQTLGILIGLLCYGPHATTGDALETTGASDTEAISNKSLARRVAS